MLAEIGKPRGLLAGSLLMLMLMLLLSSESWVHARHDLITQVKTRREATEQTTIPSIIKLEPTTIKLGDLGQNSTRNDTTSKDNPARPNDLQNSAIGSEASRKLQPKFAYDSLMVAKSPSQEQVSKKSTRQRENDRRLQDERRQSQSQDQFLVSASATPPTEFDDEADDGLGEPSALGDIQLEPATNGSVAHLDLSNDELDKGALNDEGDSGDVDDDDDVNDESTIRTDNLLLVYARANQTSPESINLSANNNSDSILATRSARNGVASNRYNLLGHLSGNTGNSNHSKLTGNRNKIQVRWLSASLPASAKFASSQKAQQVANIFGKTPNDSDSFASGKLERQNSQDSRIVALESFKIGKGARGQQLKSQQSIKFINPILLTSNIKVRGGELMVVGSNETQVQADSSEGENVHNFSANSTTEVPLKSSVALQVNDVADPEEIENGLEPIDAKLNESTELDRLDNRWIKRQNGTNSSAREGESADRKSSWSPPPGLVLAPAIRVSSQALAVSDNNSSSSDRKTFIDTRDEQLKDLWHLGKKLGLVRNKSRPPPVDGLMVDEAQEAQEAQEEQPGEGRLLVESLQLPGSRRPLPAPLASLATSNFIDHSLNPLGASGDRKWTGKGPPKGGAGDQVEGEGQEAEEEERPGFLQRPLVLSSNFWRGAADGNATRPLRTTAEGPAARLPQLGGPFKHNPPYKQPAEAAHNSTRRQSQRPRPRPRPTTRPPPGSPWAADEATAATASSRVTLSSAMGATALDSASSAAAAATTSSTTTEMASSPATPTPPPATPSSTAKSSWLRNRLQLAALGGRVGPRPPQQNPLGTGGTNSLAVGGGQATPSALQLSAPATPAPLLSSTVANNVASLLAQRLSLLVPRFGPQVVMPARAPGGHAHHHAGLLATGGSRAGQRLRQLLAPLAAAAGAPTSPNRRAAGVGSLLVSGLIYGLSMLPALMALTGVNPLAASTQSESPGHAPSPTTRNSAGGHSSRAATKPRKVAQVPALAYLVPLIPTTVGGGGGGLVAPVTPPSVVSDEPDEEALASLPVAGQSSALRALYAPPPTLLGGGSAFELSDLRPLIEDLNTPTSHESTRGAHEPLVRRRKATALQLTPLLSASDALGLMPDSLGAEPGKRLSTGDSRASKSRESQEPIAGSSRPSAVLAAPATSQQSAVWAASENSAANSAAISLPELGADDESTLDFLLAGNSGGLLATPTGVAQPIPLGSLLVEDSDLLSATSGELSRNQFVDSDEILALLGPYAPATSQRPSSETGSRQRRTTSGANLSTPIPMMPSKVRPTLKPAHAMIPLRSTPFNKPTGSPRLHPVFIKANRLRGTQRAQMPGQSGQMQPQPYTATVTRVNTSPSLTSRRIEQQVQPPHQFGKLRNGPNRVPFAPSGVVTLAAGSYAHAPAGGSSWRALNSLTKTSGGKQIASKATPPPIASTSTMTTNWDVRSPANKKNDFSSSVKSKFTAHRNSANSLPFKKARRTDTSSYSDGPTSSSTTSTTKTPKLSELERKLSEDESELLLAHSMAMGSRVLNEQINK